MFAGSRYLFLDRVDEVTGAFGRTDGTAAGTIALSGVDEGRDQTADGFAEVAGRVYALVDVWDGTALYVSEGTAATTKRVSTYLDKGYARQLTAAAGALFFVLDGELWRNDGTSGGDTLVKDLNLDGYSNPTQLRAAGRYLYFLANGTQLWRSDGSEAGTILLKNIGSGFEANLTAAGEWLYFNASDATYGVELWRTDGTETGTGMVADLYPGHDVVHASQSRVCRRQAVVRGAGSGVWRRAVPHERHDAGAGERSRAGQRLVDSGRVRAGGSAGLLRGDDVRHGTGVVGRVPRRSDGDHRQRAPRRRHGRHAHDALHGLAQQRRRYVFRAVRDGERYRGRERLHGAQRNGDVCRR